MPFDMNMMTNMMIPEQHMPVMIPDPSINMFYCFVNCRQFERIIKRREERMRLTGSYVGMPFVNTEYEVCITMMYLMYRKRSMLRGV